MKNIKKTIKTLKNTKNEKIKKQLKNTLKQNAKKTQKHYFCFMGFRKINSEITDGKRRFSTIVMPTPPDY